MPAESPSVRRGPIALLLLLLMTVALFWPLLAEQRVFFYGDFDKFFYPAKLQVARALAEGHLPVWDPTIMGGMPVLAHPLYGAAYPPSLILAFLPFHAGLGAFFALHYLLAGLFTYCLLREWKVSPASSLVAALSFAFGGVMMSSASLSPILQTMTWFPMMVFCFQRAIDRGSGVYLVLSALALALMFYGGEVHLAYAALMVLFLWAATETVRNLRQQAKPRGSHAPAWPPIAFVVIVFIGILLSLPLLLPTGVFASLSTRAMGLSLEEASRFSLRPGGLIGFMSPSLFFDNRSYTSWYEITGVLRTSYFLSLYAGAVPLVLSFVGMAASGRRFRWFFLALLLLSVAAAMGRHTPLFSHIHRYLPLMAMFRYPEKFLAFSALFLAIFSGLGAEALMRLCSFEQVKGASPDHPVQNGTVGQAPMSPTEKAEGSEKGSAQGTRMMLKWLLPWVIIIGFALAYGVAHREQFIALMKMINVFDVPLSGEAENYRAYHGAVMMDLVKFIGFVTALLVLSVIALKTRRGSSLMAPALVALTALDLLMAHHGLNPTAPEEIYLKPPEVVRYLEKEDEPYRIHSLIFDKKRGRLPLSFSSVYSIYLWEKEALKPNIGAVYGLHYANGESALRLSAQRNFINLIRGAPPGQKEKLLGLYNVKFMLAFYSQEGELAPHHDDIELRHRFEKSGILLYRNKRYLPRVYYVPAARMVGSEGQALSALLNEDFDPSKEVIVVVERTPSEPRDVERGDSTPGSEGSPTHVFPEILEYSDSLVSVGTNFREGGYLVFSDVYYPGWTVTVDGKPAELLRANYLFRAVKLAPGMHFVRFSYTPQAFIRGMHTGLTMAALATILVLVFYFLGRRRAETLAANKLRGAYGSHQRGG